MIRQRVLKEVVALFGRIPHTDHRGAWSSGQTRPVALCDQLSRMVADVSIAAVSISNHTVLPESPSTSVPHSVESESIRESPQPPTVNPCRIVVIGTRVSPSETAIRRHPPLKERVSSRV